eukprot:COSAG02_NODE_51026_length_317_cov_0.449541_1_plen_58_part_10
MIAMHAVIACRTFAAATARLINQPGYRWRRDNYAREQREWVHVDSVLLHWIRVLLSPC